MIIGFTGTREGMSPAQLSRVRARLMHPTTTILHHGDCVGSDAEAHEIMCELGKPVEIHPPVNTKKRAFCASLHPALVIHEPREYYLRNCDIVDACDYLLATPRGPELSSTAGNFVPYSGTWITIQYARQVQKPAVIIFPSGVIVRERLDGDH